jgi:hypothetical protein
MPTLLRSMVIPILALDLAVGSEARGQQTAEPSGAVGPVESLAEAQQLFYDAHYDAAATLAMPASSQTDVLELAVSELRSNAVLFQIRRAIGEVPNKEKAFRACAPCQNWMTIFMRDITRGQNVARERLKADPKDETALFFLGKLDLNYVWLVLGTLGRKTGWNEYWEARRALDAVLLENPGHVRARVARAWVDYIVDTKMPWGTGWMLGGGNKKRALSVMREAAAANEDVFTNAEAGFGLWDMQVREKNFKGALETARQLAIVFPNNAELARFIDVQSTRLRP